jgi:hypothetical protein
MLLTVVDVIWSSTSAASPASPASLHGSNPPSLMFSSFQLPQEGFARLAHYKLSCSILSTREDPWPTKSAGSVQGAKGARRGWLQSSDSRHRYRIVTLQHQRHDAVATTAFSGLSPRHSSAARRRLGEPAVPAKRGGIANGWLLASRIEGVMHYMRLSKCGTAAHQRRPPRAPPGAFVRLSGSLRT